MNISKNKSLTFLSLLFILVISFVISVTCFCIIKSTRLRAFSYLEKYFQIICNLL